MALYLNLMGVQGSGKGTQAQLISQKYGIPHVSTGDLFRAMRKRSDELARRVQEIMEAGRLIDDETTNAVVADRLAQADAAGGAILDGYPRNVAQADFLAGYLAERGQRVNAVILMHLDLYVAFKRAFGRVTAADGRAYNIYYQRDGLDIEIEKHPEGLFPPRVVVRRGEEVLQRRADDADAMAVIKRIDTYLAETQPLVDYYQARGLLHTVDADRPIEAVSADLYRLIDESRG
jgi:adenylate kinase